MKVARFLLLVLLAVLLVLFAVANWLPVEVKIGAGLVLETKLPLLVIGAFLLGLVPTWAIHRLAVWRLERRMAVLAGQTSPAVAAGGDPAQPAAPPAPAPAW